MDEYSTPVNDGQASDESLQTTAETTETVNADSAEVTNGEMEQTEDGSKQETDAQTEVKQEPSTQSKEENAQFAKVRKEAEARVRAEVERVQAAKDVEFAQLATESGWVDANGNPIKTETEYWKAVKAQREIDTLINQGEDPKTARLQVEYDRLKAERETERNATEEQTRRNAENAEFFELFKEANNREFTNDDVVPPEVFIIANENNLPLPFAYSHYLAKQSIAEKKNIAIGKQTAEVNAKNATTSTGSVTGSPQSGAITESEINAHSDDISWMNKNFKKVEEYYRKKG